MSSEDAISILPDSESPEIMMVSQKSNAGSLVPPTGDTLMSLLLQIQQFHSSELQKQQAELNRMKLKCKRLAMVANDNATMAKRYIKHCKGLKAKVLELKCQLRVLQSPLRQDGTSVPSKSDTSPPDQALQVDVPAQAPSCHLEELGRATAKQPTKLASRKSKKKVRYSDVPTNPGLQQQAVYPSLEASSGLPGASRVKVEPGLRNENRQFDSSEAGSFQNVRVGDILALDTCASPAVRVSEGNTSSGLGSRRRTDHTSPLDDQRLGSVGHHVRVVPETVEVGDEFGEGSLVDAPAYASTPIGSQTQMSMLSDSMQILDHKMPASAHPSRKAASFTSSNRGTLLPSPLPKSESQFPVDLSSTQAKSPTFCGEGLSNMTTPRGANDQAQQHSTPNTEWTVPTPNTGDRLDPRDADESYESEASMLLLRPGIQKPAILANPFRPSFISPAGASGRASPEINQEKNQTSYEDRSKRLEVSKAVLQNVKQGGCREGTSTAKRTQAGPSRASASKKRKLDLENETTYDETVLDLDSSGKENSPESLNVQTNKASSQTLNRIKEKQVALPPELSRAVELRGKGRSLKQSKINPDMFRSGTNKSASLMQEYNGGRLVNIDSQSDDFMRRAIELSLADQNQTGAGDGIGSEVTGSFKVPALPQAGHMRQHHCIPETKVEALQHLSEQREAELLDSLPEVSFVIDTPHDLNGSVDPLVDLTRMEEEGSFPLDPRITPGTSYAKHLETRRHASGESGPGDDSMEGMHPQTAHDSCQDLFDEGEESDSDEDLEDLSTIRDQPQFIKDFDKVPKKDDKPNFKYTEVVRKHEERQKLKGFGCKECDKYYAGMSMTDAQREQRIKMCSRHRALYSPPSTPEHYWSVGFPDTQTIQERGYIKESTGPERPTRKRKNRYKRNFFGKEVDDARDGEPDNDQ